MSIKNTAKKWINQIVELWESFAEIFRGENETLNKFMLKALKKAPNEA